MNKLRFGLIGLSVFALSIITACNKDNDNDGPCRGYVNWSLSVSDEAAALSAAASAYGQDPSSANCVKYKEAYNDYIDALDSQSNCVPASQRAAFDQSLDDARDELNNLPC
tara:strand:+ start:367 stop:699 length:333 start_codon:yes stop_codon:yes gene_type:complete